MSLLPRIHHRLKRGCGVLLCRVGPVETAVNMRLECSGGVGEETSGDVSRGLCGGQDLICGRKEIDTSLAHLVSHW